MSASEHSLWALLGDAHATLAPHAILITRTIRNETWTILRNEATGEHVRINNCLYTLLLRLNGTTSVAEHATAAGLLLPQEDAHPSTSETQSQSSEAEAAPRGSGDEVDKAAAALAQGLLLLAQQGLVQLNLDSDAERLLQEHDRLRQSVRQRPWLNPLAIRLPLHDPDRWLARFVPLLEKLNGRYLCTGLTALICGALILAISDVQALAQDFKRLVSSPSHWWLIGVIYPVLKGCHELAHALMVKSRGGHVHEVGLTLLVLLPVPYMDASDASLFSRRRDRLAVSAAGMLMEMTLAALAYVLWSLVEPGLVRDLAFVTALTGSLTTILFNANPLLKFDGYQLLQDAIDIPNLGSRSSRYLQYLLRRYALRNPAASHPTSAAGERRWFVGYGIAAILYRCFITWVIVLYLVKQVFFIGVLLACFALFQLAVRPLVQALRYLRSAPELRDCRSQAVWRSAFMVGLLLTTVLVVPVPSSTRAEGIVWVPGQAELLAAEAGEVLEVLVSPGSWVRAGDTILRLSAPQLHTEMLVLENTIAMLEQQRQAAMQQDMVEARLLALDQQHRQRNLDSLKARLASLEVKARSDGRFAPPPGPDLLGQIVARGDSLGFLVHPGELLVKAVVEQHRQGQVQAGVSASYVRLAERFGTRLPATLIAETAAADHALPSPALASNGSGGIAVAMSSNEALETLDPVFHIDLRLPEAVVTAGIGGRAYVTLVHPAESLGKRWWRMTRQLFLEQLFV